MVDARHGDAVLRNLTEEGQERLVKGGLRAVIVEMLRVDICHNADFCRQPDEGAVRFIGLDDHPSARSDPGIRSPGANHAADKHGWIEAGFNHHPAGHGRCRGLSVGTGD